MELLVARTPSRQTCTISPLFVNAATQQQCFILENVVDEVIGEDPAIWKESDGRNAVPVGRYPVQWTFSQHFQKMTPEILGVPGFEGVRIHGGNRDTDTEGCLVTGTAIGADQESVTGSDVARDILYDLINRAITAGEEVWITIQPPAPIAIDGTVL